MFHRFAKLSGGGNNGQSAAPAITLYYESWIFRSSSPTFSPSFRFNTFEQYAFLNETLSSPSRVSVTEEKDYRFV